MNVVVIGSSAGGIRALGTLLEGLPPELDAAVLVVQHVDRRHPSHMAAILERRTELGVAQASEGDRLERGQVLVAPPDRHLVLSSDQTLSLSRSDPVRFVRPSVDRLFETVATSCRERVLGVILSGTGSDGSSGIRAIKREGGSVIVQDPASAEFAGMPRAAVLTGCADRVLPLEAIADAIVAIAGRVPNRDREACP